MEQTLRQLARSSYWQSKYSASKDLNCFALFTNLNNFSGLQLYFLNWIKVYNMLYSELDQLADNYLSENVIKDDDRCDAYLYYRRKKIESEWKKVRHEEHLNSLKNRHSKKRSPDAQIIDVELRTK